MKIRLVHSLQGDPAPDGQVSESASWKFVVLMMGAFFVLKFPLLFTSQNPEELRDFDHFLRTSAGALPFRDYVWLYGPLTPLIFGPSFESLACNLAFTSCFEPDFLDHRRGVLFGTPAKVDPSPLVHFLGILFVTGGFGYHTYSHNHILPAVGLIACIHFFLKYWLDGDLKAHRYSFVAALIIFLCRPILMGYGALFCWFFLTAIRERRNREPSQLIVPLIAVLGSLLLFYAVYGKAFLSCLAPPPWAILDPKGYPNLHYAIPHVQVTSWLAVNHSLKSIRASLETLIFYGHYFIWPTFIFATVYFQRTKRNVVAASLCTGFGVIAGFDLLHYGFSDPSREQAMWVRGQYFFSLTAMAIFLFTVPVLLNATIRWYAKAGLVLGLVIIGVWSYIPWFAGTSHYARFSPNELDFPVLRGIFTHEDRRPMLEAIHFINGRCKVSDRVVIPQYDPGLSRLLKCADLFEKDSYLFTRSPYYRLKPNETPYAPEGKIENGELIRKVIAQAQPRFYLVQGESDYAASCMQKGWKTASFGVGANGRRVCWGPELEHPLSHSIPE